MRTLDRPRRNLAYGAACIAGFVDATGFLAASGYFVSFMSGNTTRLGADLASAITTAWVPAALIAGFVVGVIGGALLAEAAQARRKVAVLTLTAALLILAATGATLGAPDIAIILLLATAMGTLNNTFQRDGEVAVGLTYMTGALVRMGQGIAARLTGRSDDGWLAWFGLWLALAGGALGGALAWRAIGMTGLWIAAIATALLAAIAGRIRVP